MTVGDVNNDASPDLVVGAPFAPAGGIQNGFITALYASKYNTGKTLSLFVYLNLKWRKLQNSLIWGKLNYC